MTENETVEYVKFLKENDFNDMQIQLLVVLRDEYLNQCENSNFYYQHFAHNVWSRLKDNGLFEHDDAFNKAGIWKWNLSDVKQFITDWDL